MNLIQEKENSKAVASCEYVLWAARKYVTGHVNYYGGLDGSFVHVYVHNGQLQQCKLMDIPDTLEQLITEL